jgi:DNA-binding transcriptional LysR family regulator
MEVKDLRCFIAVYETKNFAQAAAALHTVQSNVSAHIRKLEGVLGVELFERHRRGALPTEKGEQLYAYAKRVIDLLEEAAESMHRKEAVRSRPDKSTLTPIIS